MKRLVLIGLVALGACSTNTENENQLKTTYPSPYMDAKNTELFEIHNGALVTQETKDYWDLETDSPQRVSYDEEIMVEAAPGVWTYGSESIVNLHVVKAPEGLIIFDTGDNDKDGLNFYKHIREVSDEPIKAIVYTHSHYALGARVIVDEEAKRGNTDILVIGHPKLNEELITTGGLAALYPEVSGVLLARSMEQFNMFAPVEGPESRYKNTIVPGNAGGYVPVNTPVNHLQKMNVAGLDMVFYTEGIATDTRNQVLAYFPGQKIVVNNVLWGWFPNIYSIRGGKYRDPGEWVNSIEVMQDLKPNILLSSHSVTLNDPEKIQETLQDYKDGLSFVLDQTLKGIMLGLNPEELQYYVTANLPKQLEEAPILVQNYGDVMTMPGRIYTAIFGQYDRNAANIVKLHPADEAARMVNAMGGEQATFKKAKAAFDNGDYLWAVQLSDYLVRLNPAQHNKQLKADCLRQMGYRTLATNSRSWMISQAQDLEGKVAIPTAMPAIPASVVTNLYDYFSYYRIRINPNQAGTVNQSIAVDFGKGQVYGLEVRNGVAYTYADLAEMKNKPSMTLSMKPEDWVLIYNNLASPTELITNYKIRVTDGSKENAIHFFSMFDQLFDWENDPALQAVKQLL
ncbi:alkyl sulfatase dimerization domain-containing protein [uncultured Draconibacterium sp.]|uniref:alkyl sulfatase dimerization domain-containing protein n=1 Tax=uncultured Draconibacterium sp. TaxID=1573823 RepID=UPI0029C7466E|nr:alkyl sulfatase dimerization domain-containing protein [uncultured Draconibacterium sp.]